MKWFNIWFEDAQSVIETMIRNMKADIDAGYDPVGGCIRRQQEEITERQSKFNIQMDDFKDMDDANVNRWYFYDLKKRGVIL